MWFFWVFSLVPILVGVGMMYFNRRVNWKEWLISCCVSLAMAGIFQLAAIQGMTGDTETWSGYGTSARQYSRWKEYYEYAVYRTEYYTERESYTEYDSKGRGHTRYRTVTKSRRVFDHWEPTSRWHNATWTLFTTIKDFDISEAKFDYMCNKYNDRHAVPGKRTTWEHNSKMIDGDPNDYVADNKTGWIEPATITKSFENRVKAAPSLFSFAKVPTNINVHAWPSNPDWNRSDRVMGTASTMIDGLKWDQLNAVLGASKQINLIVIGFPEGSPSDMGRWQEAKFIGGKKNDLVITYAGNKNEKAEWCYVFGWTEKNIVKLNIQDLFTQNKVNNGLIDKIAEEVKTNYVRKDWHKFDYISIEPPSWSYWVYLIVMVLVQGGLYVWYNFNEWDNDSFDKQVNYAYFGNKCRNRFGDWVHRVAIWFSNVVDAFKRFFIKSAYVAANKQPPEVKKTDWPPSQYRSYENERMPIRRKNRRNWE